MMKKYVKYLLPSKRRILITLIIIGSVQLYFKNGYVHTWLWNLEVCETTLVKGNKTVTLLGMAHVANLSFYKKVKEISRDKFVISEGLRGLGENSIDHSLTAELFKLTTQPKIDQLVYEYKNGDIHIDDLSIETQSDLGDIFIAFESILSLNTAIEIKGFDYFRLYKDIIINRNENLYVNIEKELIIHDNLLIPWGALHLSGIQEMLENDGFVLKDRKSHQILNLFESSYNMVLYLIKELI